MSRNLGSLQCLTMAFVVKQKIKGKDYYYLRKSFRKDGKVISRHIAYLGKTREEAEKKAKEIIKNMTKSKGEKKVGKINMIKKDISIEDMAGFCKRRGFVYGSGEIYGGLAGFWDFGNLGVELKSNIKKEWWKFHVYNREDIVGIDGAIITNPKVWEASGHVSNFVDIAVVCKKCGNKTKLDKFELGKVNCEKCGGEFESKGEFNPMFTTQVGPIKQDSLKSYLRPETAQLIFTNFKAVYDNARMKLPFGIAQVGKAFRNEIAPRDFLFRAREFEQMEIEYFIKPEQTCPYKLRDSEKNQILVYSSEMQKKNKKAQKMKIKDAYKNKIIKTDWHAYWLEQEFLWFVNLGANPENFRIRQHMDDERAHYASDCWDLEYRFPFGWKELEGIANRGDFDLRQHEKYSKKDLKIFDPLTKEKFLPHVVCEPSLGLGRAFLVFMFDSYFYDKERQNIVLKLNPKLSPVKAAIFPIVKKKNFQKLSRKIYDELKKEWNIIYDSGGSIGRRYSRQDEIGTPVTIAIDEQTPKDNTVTLRDRDTTEQIRVKISDVKEVISKIIEGESLLKFGKRVHTRIK